jgi:hypothetical protein
MTSRFRAAYELVACSASFAFAAEEPAHDLEVF